MSNKLLNTSSHRNPIQIKVGARDSALSKAQVEEIIKLTKDHHIDVNFLPTLTKTTGDLDQKTSLRLLEKSDFFTKELDTMLASGEVDIAIHSAKDLPDPLHPDLCMIALTQGVDPSDSLVYRQGEHPSSLFQPKIATSSIRREEGIKQLFPEAVLVDIRGNIQQRLDQLFVAKTVDAVIIAHAALIRLHLLHLPYIKLNMEPAPLQGQLAILAHKNNLHLKELFSCLDCRKEILVCT